MSYVWEFVWEGGTQYCVVCKLCHSVVAYDTKFQADAACVDHSLLHNVVAIQ